MTTTLHRVYYTYSEAAEHLNLPTATIIDMVNNGTLEHTACGKRITRESLQAAMAPESEQKWLHGEKLLQIKDGGWYKRHDGEIVGPAERNRSQSYPWRLGGKAYAKGGVCSEHAVGLNLICEVPPPIDGYRPTGEFRVPVRGQDTHWFCRYESGWLLHSFESGAVPHEAIDGNKRWIAEKIPDEAEELTEADVESDGWIDWPGGECPVDGDVWVEVRQRSGEVERGMAGSFYWQDDGDQVDIVAYREVPADQSAEPSYPLESRVRPVASGEQPAEPEKQPHVVGELRQRIFSNMDDPVLLEGDELDTKTVRAMRDEVERAIADYVFDKECLSCGESAQIGECPKSKKPCGHHSDSSWTQDVCEWCGKTFGAVDVPPPEQTPPEMQPQPGWAINQFNDIGWRTIGPDGIVFLNEDGDSFEGFNVEDIEYAWEDAPECDGFRWTPPPEQTPAEKRLGEVNIEWEGNHYECTMWNPDGNSILMESDWTPDQLEAIAAHMREREGGATDE